MIDRTWEDAMKVPLNACHRPDDYEQVSTDDLVRRCFALTDGGAE